MSIAHVTRNTDKEYPCTQCGSGSTNIIREGHDPRLKCNACNFMFNGSDSTQAKLADAIPDPNDIQNQTILAEDPPEPKLDRGIDASLQEKRAMLSEEEDKKDTLSKHITRSDTRRLPRTLRYLLVSKDRSDHIFCNDKDIKQKIMQWEAAGTSYEVFQLTPKEVEAKVSIK